MSDFRRFYGHGLEHRLHLEELERSVSTSKAMPVYSEKKITAIRRLTARVLKALAERIDPSGVTPGKRATDAVC